MLRSSAPPALALGRLLCGSISCSSWLPLLPLDREGVWTLGSIAPEQALFREWLGQLGQLLESLTAQLCLCRLQGAGLLLHQLTAVSSVLFLAVDESSAVGEQCTHCALVFAGPWNMAV